MSFGNPQIISSAGSMNVQSEPVFVPPGPIQPNKGNTVLQLITKNSPVNVLHPDFAGGADPTGTFDSTAAINAAITYAATFANGGRGEVFIPAGVYNISARLQLNGVLGLKIFGEGLYATVIRQQTSNEPIIESSANSGVWGCEVSDLRLIYATQQTVALHPNSAAIRLLNTNINGFNDNIFRNLRIELATYVIQWGPPQGNSNAVSFWNNNIDLIQCVSITGALLKNSSGAAVGGPTNKINLLSHVGAGVAPTGIALDLGAGHEFVFTSLDIEDWSNTLLNIGGDGNLIIDGAHLERQHLVTSVPIFVIDGCQFDIRNIHGSYYRDGTGPYYLFNFTDGSIGYCGGVDSYDTAGGLGAGTVRHFTMPVAGATLSTVTLGPRTSHSAAFVDWLASESGILASCISDNGAPPQWDSSVALPAASATYRGRLIYLKGTNTSTTDQLVACQQSDQNTYAWVPVSNSARSGTATLVAGSSGSIADTKITASSLIRITNIGAGGTLGILSVALAAGTGFTINSSNAADTSKVFWEIVSY